MTSSITRRVSIRTAPWRNRPASPSFSTRAGAEQFAILGPTEYRGLPVYKPMARGRSCSRHTTIRCGTGYLGEEAVTNPPLRGPRTGARPSAPRRSKIACDAIFGEGQHVPRRTALGRRYRSRSGLAARQCAPLRRRRSALACARAFGTKSVHWTDLPASRSCSLHGSFRSSRWSATNRSSPSVIKITGTSLCCTHRRSAASSRDAARARDSRH